MMYNLNSVFLGTTLASPLYLWVLGWSVFFKFLVTVLIIYLSLCYLKVLVEEYHEYD